MAAATPRLRGRLIIHTGDHKTGTTAVQTALKRGVVQPVNGRLCYPVPEFAFNHNFAFPPIRRRRWYQWPRPLPDQQFRKVAELALAENAELTVISAENLEDWPPRGLDRMLARLLPVGREALSVVTYLRPHLERLTSELSERIKIGWAAPDPWDTAEAILRNQLAYAPRVAGWAQVFGQSYHVRPMIRDRLLNGSILEDLFTTALGPGQVTVEETATANESLGVEDLMRLHVIHQSLPDLDRGQHHNLGWALSRKPELMRAEGGPRTPLKLHRALAELEAAALRSDARKLDSRWFAGAALFEPAIERGLAKALPERMPLAPRDWLEPEEIAGLTGRAAEFRAMVSGPDWRMRMRAERLEQLRGQGPA